MSTSRSRTTTGTDKPSARRGAEPPIEPESAEWSNPASASTAESESGAGPSDATLATSSGTATPIVRSTGTPLGDIGSETGTRDDSGSETIAAELASTSRTLPRSGKRSTTWRTPRNAREWAAQLNHLATSVLNGTVDLEEAKVVSSISRSAAQLLTAEVQRARFLQIEPDLSLEFDETLENSPETPNEPENPE